MSKFQKVRGTRDIYGKEKEMFNFVLNIAKEIAYVHNFNELDVPMFELTEVFERNLGETSDVVSKEMYTFKDRSDQSITLRPEFTAGVVRAVNENHELLERLPAKLLSYGSVFRYDRPQKGRYRQFNQINCECFGEASHLCDVEIISLAYKIITALNIPNVKLEINSLGCEVSRANYEKELVEYLRKNESFLSEDSKNRLKTNPLRILDSKDVGDRALLESAPVISDFYEPEAEEFFKNVLHGLDVLDIEYEINPKLVRGLDYYTSTVFEFVTTELGAQGTVLAGGRYDNMMKEMGGKDLPAFGFGAGIERLALLAQHDLGCDNVIAIIPVSENEIEFCFKLLDELREYGARCEMPYANNLKKRMQKANKLNSPMAIIIGEEETRSKTYKIKNLEDGTEKNVTKDKLLYEIDKEW